MRVGGYNNMIYWLLASAICAEKVKIGFYSESLCPYCNQFATTSMSTALNTTVQC
jgi:hypothetical protein